MNLDEQIKEANVMREEWAENDAKRDQGLKEPKGIQVIKDISYTTSESKEEEVWHLTDIYLPLDESIKKYPVIVSIHGGGWFYGDKELYRFYTMHLASKGFAVVNFNYRRSPEYKYPSGFYDICALMDFIMKHQAEYKLDMERLYIVGDSAGAQYASQYAIYATNESYRTFFDWSKQMNAPVPLKLGLNCGIYDMKERYENDKLICGWYLDEQMPKDLLDSFTCVLDYLTGDFPESFVMISVNDDLAPRTKALLKKLEQEDVSYEYKEYGQENPEDGHVFHLNLYSEDGKKCNEDEIAFFKNDE